jgi:hypothetical protein
MRPAALLALGLLATPLVQAATPVVIDFETPTSFASVADHYNGGTDSAGLAGADLGAAFGGDLLALRNDVAGTYFDNAPSPLGVLMVVGTEATLNVERGFTGALALSYASADFVLQGVNVYSGLNATGRLLASFNLAANAQADGCSSAPLCRFDQISSTFAGTAHSISFANAANSAVFDDIRISAVPEPTTALMLALGLSTLMLARRRG